MTKRYLVSEDEFSGQVVIVCRTYEKEVDVYVPTIDEVEASMYLYRSCPKKMENRTFYEVSAYYHYEDAERRKQNCLFNRTTGNKDEANDLFKQALLVTR